MPVSYRACGFRGNIIRLRFCLVFLEGWQSELSNHIKLCNYIRGVSNSIPVSGICGNGNFSWKQGSPRRRIYEKLREIDLNSDTGRKSRLVEQNGSLHKIR
ncbi:unnamed protein product [Acanthoscelides obtectus]|uniref:Uncharacterized protein n=1 Tax=Acanthoscelides obtectus TaxID=200917 RepID=A0A9P0JPW7_ACAOB|nr:unnamed protein product [Acanthoscelides obtectus]CAK1667039.1 hypothetical protein AOBTE_LOCUS25634 [Acanthoscelides obtectus]